MKPIIKNLPLFKHPYVPKHTPNDFELQGHMVREDDRGHVTSRVPVYREVYRDRNKYSPNECERKRREKSHASDG